MIKIYPLSEAKEGILKRKPIYQDSYSPATIARTESVFGEAASGGDANFEVD